MAEKASVIVPYAAYLRVYEPLAAFPEPERAHWIGYAKQERFPSAQDEVRRALADLLPVPPVVVPERESAEAFVTEVDGVTCVCPWRTRLRSWQALSALTQASGDRAPDLPQVVLDAALPPVVRRQAAADYERWREHNPDARPWIRTALWHVPVRWFVLFVDEEREFAKPESGEESGQQFVLRYRTPMAQARRRLARGLKVLREELEEGPLVEGLVDVGRWLEEFHPRSLVELDYGGLAHAIPEEQLAGDHSAADVAEGLAALRVGDGERAGEAYGRLTDRWRAIRELQFAS
ncbi:MULTISPECIES: hypothetical protein [unclassified Streptomyces]|uniref:hypothetical protein n=1 Tax=unclassified Streptomyces TaxID=2593676 RepID=UPI002DDB4662|nr:MULTISPECIES: hypothetical protein [unclassified Streptomyces]WSA93433.1 hypothetical protein OIE63_19000 [Streptomyces sp. NBC_01795]WSB77802.1 hypothetical protein OHB04_19830 [Streptomyces sp. NBC_01775]WSS13950.1 hypothetical protein OG533_20220 [Streptomyces sp. NBC_01186]WSS42763.1 hypothetical protein OG220_20895 [Streptomyces sp. NBC_01187]